MRSRLIEIFEDEELVEKIKKRLPYLFQLAEIESSRAGKVGMEVGSLRERIVVALLIYKFGEANVETEIHITEPEVDVSLFGEPLSIKTITGNGDAYKEIAEVIATNLDELGFDVKIYDGEKEAKDGIPRPNIVAKKDFGSKKTLGLLTHYDVVPPGTGWSHDPFDLVVINADDFYGPSAYQMIADYMNEADINESHPNFCMVGYKLKYTLSENGYVSRGVCETDEQSFLKTVVERTSIERINNKIITKLNDGSDMELTGEEDVSMNIWGFTPSYFGFLEEAFGKFILENLANPKAEFYIPTVVNDLIEGDKINMKVLESKDKWFGVTYKEDKDDAVRDIAKLIKQGVYPEKLW